MSADDDLRKLNQMRRSDPELDALMSEMERHGAEADAIAERYADVVTTYRAAMRNQWAAVLGAMLFFAAERLAGAGEMADIGPTARTSDALIAAADPDRPTLDEWADVLLDALSEASGIEPMDLEGVMLARAGRHDHDDLNERKWVHVVAYDGTGDGLALALAEALQHEIDHELDPGTMAHAAESGFEPPRPSVLARVSEIAETVYLDTWEHLADRASGEQS